MMVNLSRPAFAHSPRIAPSRAPGVLGRRHDLRACVHDALGAVEQLPDVDAHQRGGNHAEVGERRVAPADVRRVEEDALEAVALRVLLHLRAGVCDGDEVLAGFSLTLADLPYQ
jgi:hypothetical protein